MGAPASQNLEDVVEGDTWLGLTSVTITVDGSPPGDALASVAMTFKKSKRSGPASLELVSSGSEITLTDAANWIFAVAEVTPFPLKPGVYVYDVQTTDDQGVIQTYLEGEIEVLKRV